MNKTLRYSLKGFGGLVALLVAFHVVEDLRGHHAWTSYLDERRSAGLPMDFASLAPAPVPDAENFAAVPLIDNAIKGKNAWGVSFAPITPAWEAKANGDWRIGKPADLKAIQALLKTDLDGALAPYGPVFAELSEATLKARSRFLIHYENPDEVVPPLLGFRSVARTLRLRAQVNLDKGRDAAALADTQTGLRLAQQFRAEPVLLAQLLRTACLSLSLQGVWEGLQRHRWNESQVASLQEQLKGVDLLASWTRSLQGEQALHIQYPHHGWWADFKQGKHWSTPEDKVLGRTRVLLRSAFMPMGWRYQNQVRSARLFDALCMAPVDAANHRVRVGSDSEATQALASPHHSPYNFLIPNYVPALSHQVVRISRIQTGLDHAYVACALERYHLANKAYPAELQELAGTYLTEMPHDLMTGASFHYERTAAGGYRLWSVGWDGKDDGGKAGTGAQELENGDWCWTVAQ